MNLSALIEVLPIMAKGLGGVFFVIALIWVFIAVMSRFSR